MYTHVKLCSHYIASYLVSYPFKDKSGDGLSLVTKQFLKAPIFCSLALEHPEFPEWFAAVVTISVFIWNGRMCFWL